MNISFQARPKGENSASIRVIITHNGKVYRKALGVSVEQSQWNKSKQKCSNVNTQSQLMAIRVGLESTLSDVSTERDIMKALRRIEDGKWKDLSLIDLDARNRPSLWDYFKEWSERPLASQRQRALSYRRIKDIMGDLDDWEDIDSGYYFRFIKKCDDLGYSKNYQGTMVNNLKIVMSEGYKQKWHKNEEFREFTRTSEPASAIYLSTDEIEAIWNLDLKDSLQAKVRDIFIVGLYTGARYEDYSLFTMNNIYSDGFLHFTQGKTTDDVIIPVHPRVIEVMKRNGGRVPRVHQNIFNDEVKLVCQRARINEKVQLKKNHGRITEIVEVEKWEAVSSHTARRSVVTNLAKSGVPAHEVMQISGHKSMQAYQRYLKQTFNEVAANLATNPYFQEPKKESE